MNEADQKQTDAIINGCKSGDRWAQEKLYRSYYQKMMNLCLRYTKNDTDAMEALNTGFCKVFKHIHSYNQTKASLYTWISRIIINSCLDLIKLRKDKTPPSQLYEAIDIAIAPEVLSKIKSDELLMIVRQLPPATQAAFNLFGIEGYSHKEISKILGISENTSKWHISEAKKLLQEMITNEINKNE